MTLSQISRVLNARLLMPLGNRDFLKREVQAMNAEINLGFTIPDPSRSSRKISWRSRASCRGTVVLTINGKWQIVVYESLLELMCILLICSRGDVVDVWDQPTAMSFTLPDGSRHEHTFICWIILEIHTGTSGETKVRMPILP